MPLLIDQNEDNNLLKQTLRAKTIWLTCKSECCNGRKTRHDHNRVADDGRVMYTCRDCGEERSQS